MEFLKGMKDFARNPLGIIALFISLIYGFASLLLNSAAEKLTQAERWPIIIFIVIFPLLVLLAFYRLVTKHHGKLYAPGDYKDDKSFLRTLSQEEREQKLDKEVEEVLPEPGFEQPVAAEKSKQGLFTNRKIEYSNFKEELRRVEAAAIKKLERELNKKADLNVAIADTGVNFDALFQGDKKFNFIEVKVLNSPRTIDGGLILDRLLYNAVVADKYFNSNFKLTIMVVYHFDKKELPRVEDGWRRRIEKCPADIELRFFPREDLYVEDLD